MKARLLKQLLGNTTRPVHDNGQFICVGSAMVNCLISIDKATLKLKNAFDTYNKGRESVKDSSDLLAIWDKLQALIDSGEIQEIIAGKDLIDNPLPVFTIEEGELIESVTDSYEWPSTTEDGKLMYTNTYFKTAKEAIEWGIKDNEAGARMLANTIRQISEDLQEKQKWLAEELSNIEKLKTLLKDYE